MTKKTVLLTNNIAAEILCGLGARARGGVRIFVNRGDEYQGLSALALRMSLGTCAACVATTPYQEVTLRGKLGVSSEKITVIPNGVDEQAVSPNGRPLAQPDWHTPGRIHIATLGFPSERKNQALLVRSIALLRSECPSVLGLIIGSPSHASDYVYLDYLKRLIAELDIEESIRFVPFTDDKAVLFGAIDILASTATREGFGRTIIEAMAYGRPVVAKKAGGPESIIEHGKTGLLVNNNDPREFAHALRELIDGPALRDTIAQAARRECATRYGAQSVADRYYSLFERCTADV